MTRTEIKGKAYATLAADGGMHLAGLLIAGGGWQMANGGWLTADG